MCDEQHQGWTNRETWAANLHLFNDERIYRYIVCGYALEMLDQDREVHDRYLGEKCIEAFRSFIEDHSMEANINRDVGSWWRINEAEIGVSIREHIAEFGD